MCQFRALVEVASIVGLIQSVLWLLMAITGILVNIGAIGIPPYKTKDDFLRVTLVRLYLNENAADGSYLGGFQNVTPELLSPPFMLNVMIAYSIAQVVYFVLSIGLFRSCRKEALLRGFALSWSLLTLILCALDFLCCVMLVPDFVTFMSEVETLHRESKPGDFTEAPVIPLILMLVFSRFVALWLWNFLIGCYVFMKALCLRKTGKKSTRVLNKTPEKMKREEEPPQPTEIPPSGVSLINRSYRSGFDITSQPERAYFKKSMEGVTSFNLPEKPPSVKESPTGAWVYAPSKAFWHPKYRYSKEWEMDNEGYVSDEPEEKVDFDHNLKNFESGRRKIKVVKPPLGKPVSVPAPPPLPPPGSCNC